MVEREAAPVEELNAGAAAVAPPIAAPKEDVVVAQPVPAPAPSVEIRRPEMPRPKRRLVGPLLQMLGGLAAIVGTFLPWTHFPGKGELSLASPHSAWGVVKLLAETWGGNPWLFALQLVAMVLVAAAGSVIGAAQLRRGHGFGVRLASLVPGILGLVLAFSLTTALVSSTIGPPYGVGLTMLGFVLLIVGSLGAAWRRW